ncbi:MAG: L-fucose/L-arabinose isomerase family protein [Armatimonadota bacterium]
MVNAPGKSTFALYFGNRGFFPASLMASARYEVSKVLHDLGHKTLMMDAEATRHGAVETPAEGAIYAKFLKTHEGEFDGIILCLPNFGDENGAVAALKNAGVPILIHAYPDELDKMAPELRRDAFCGKISITDVFCQNGIKFTSLKPHTSLPGSDIFARQIDYFDRMCQVVASMKSMVIGNIGARVTAFKTVRIDEITLQRHGITVETYDLSDVFAQMKDLKSSGDAYKAKAHSLKEYTGFQCVPETAFDNLTRLAVVLDNMIVENGLDAISVRCWLEMQKQMGISPCVLLSEINNRLIPAACENDIGNAAAMYALSKASGEAAACLDWNNNYGDDEDKCILFHCGPVPQSLMTAKGTVVDHAILENAVGAGCGYGCNVGRIRPMDFTFGSLLTDNGRIRALIGEGEFVNDPIPEDFFGCPGTAYIPKLQDVLQKVVYGGYRHHVSITPGHIIKPIREAFEYYLGYEIDSVS